MHYQMCAYIMLSQACDATYDALEVNDCVHRGLLYKKVGDKHLNVTELACTSAEKTIGLDSHQ